MKEQGLALGKHAGALTVPAELVTGTTVVYGGKGMGKTNLGAVLVEELAKLRLRWSVLDPMGVWWGMRYAADGKSKGVECLVLGGAHGDIPIEPTGGAVVADLVADEDVSVIIDFSRRANGLMWSIGEKVRFVTDYALRLFQRQGELLDGGHRRQPLLQVIDEAARYIPQIIPSGAVDLARCVGAWEQICEEGRNIGLGVAFLTQRSARMNKSVSELADVMFAFRIVGPNSLKAVTDWLGQHVDKGRIAALAGDVRSLPVGSALVVSPGWLGVEKVVEIRKRWTYDSSSTPRPGQAVVRVTGHGAQPDLAAYQRRMAETIERTKAEDPRALRKRIADLEGALGRANAESERKASAKVVEVPVLTDEQLKRAEDLCAKHLGGVQYLGSQLAQLRDAALEIHRRSGVLTINGEGETEFEVDGPDPVVVNIRPSPVTTLRGPLKDGEARLSKLERALLTVLAQQGRWLTKGQVLLFAGYKASGDVSTAWSRFSREGWIHHPDGQGRIGISPAGVVALGDYVPLPTGKLLREEIVKGAPTKIEASILRILFQIYPQSMIKGQILEHTGYRPSGDASTAFSRIVRLNYAEIVGRGELRASDDLFEETK